MKKTTETRLRQNVLPVLTAMIWGTAFVAQSVGAEYVPAFTFNAARGIIAFVFLLCLCFVMRKIRVSKGQKPTETVSVKDRVIGGVCCGTALAVATSLQQLGLETTTAGKAGFITALYIVIVPILGIFLGKKTPATIWGAVALAVVGMYFLCIKEGFTISRGDFLIILCAFCFSVQIMVIDHFTEKVDGVELSCMQFLVMTILCGGMAFFTETPDIEGIKQCLPSILYLGLFSSGIAYTLQIIAQKGSNPAVVSLLMSLESVFATIAGALILHEAMTGRETLGCSLMFAAVILTQLPERKKKTV